MTKTDEIKSFLADYDREVRDIANALREILKQELPAITEQLDRPARMIAYCYGQKYQDLICTIIPSKAGVKLGFNRGTKLADPEKLLKGDGKISRYIPFSNIDEISLIKLSPLISHAYRLYQDHNSTRLK